MEDIPGIIQFLWAASVSKMPVGTKMLDEAMEKHPEYFTEELEYRRKMALVPQQVHDAHIEDLISMSTWRSSELPNTSKGLWYYSQHPDEYQDYWEASKELDKQYDFEEMERLLWNKHYEAYDLKKDPPTQQQIQAKQDEEDARALKEQQQRKYLEEFMHWLENLDPDHPLGKL